MIITNKLKMDLQNPGATPIVHTVQNDSYSRNLEITVLSGNRPFVFPDTVSVIIRYRKSDGKGGEYDTLPDGTPAWWIKGNLLTIALAPQVLTVPGSVVLSVTLIENEKHLSVFPIQIAVQPVAHANIAKSQDYFYVTNFLTAPASAKVGQQFRVASVNEAGQVISVEAFDPEPASGGGMTEEEIRSSLDAYLQEHPLPTAFYITIVGENGSYTANKTRAEVDAAFAAGRPVFCLFTGTENFYSVEGLIMPFICYMEGMALFSSYLTGINWIVAFGDAEMIMVMITESLTSDNLPETLPNPNALTFKGAVSGTYDGSRPLEITIPAGSGEPGRDGFSPTITVTNTYSPTTLPDGTIMSKINGFILKITDVNGTISKQIFYGKDGKNGTDGQTPVRGVDYWTDSDKETIIQEVITALGTPVFGTVDENNNIILTGALAEGTYTLKYEDADGNVTIIGTFDSSGGSGDDPVSGYTNQIPISTDTDGSIYNGTGYKANSRCNSSGGIADCTGGTNNPFVTGFIPCKQGDVIRLKNCYMYAHGGGDEFKAVYGQDAFGVRSGLYDSSKTMIAVESWGNLNGYTGSNMTDKFSNYTRVDTTNGYDGKIYEFTIAYAGTAYIRLSLAADIDNGFGPADAIVTVNQEIN